MEYLVELLKNPYQQTKVEAHSLELGAFEVFKKGTSITEEEVFNIGYIFSLNLRVDCVIADFEKESDGFCVTVNLKKPIRIKSKEHLMRLLGRYSPVFKENFAAVTKSAQGTIHRYTLWDTQNCQLFRKVPSAS